LGFYQSHHTATNPGENWSETKVPYNGSRWDFLPPVGWLNLRLLNVQEVAELIGVKPSTIYQWTSQGFIPHVKIGKLVRFNEDDVMKWVDATKTGGRKNRKYDVRNLGL